MNEDLSNQVKLLQDKVAGLERVINALTGGGILPHEIVSTFIKNGFLQKENTIRWTNHAGRDFYSILVNYNDNESGYVSIEPKYRYIRYTVQDLSTDTLRAPGHGLSDGVSVHLETDGGVPGGLSLLGSYWTDSTTTDTLKLKDSSGSVVDITDYGNGHNFIIPD